MSIADLFQRDRRFGTFQISRKVMETNPEEVMQVFPQCVVLEARLDWASDCMLYTAWSPLFTPVDEGRVPPMYQIRITDAAVGPDGVRKIGSVRLVRQGIAKAVAVAVKRSPILTWEKLEI